MTESIKIKTNFKTVDTGIAIPEGPISMPVGSFLCFEIQGKALVRILPNAEKQRVARVRGPNRYRRVEVGARAGPSEQR